ncbi:hypothetical protein NIES3585_13180 [Nodularia sp. NIES-3585]|nr:hypothetical protein NIES3585_13180 [Nodularia sp. NIES-3585]
MYFNSYLALILHLALAMGNHRYTGVTSSAGVQDMSAPGGEVKSIKSPRNK